MALKLGGFSPEQIQIAHTLVRQGLYHPKCAVDYVFPRLVEIAVFSKITRQRPEARSDNKLFSACVQDVLGLDNPPSLSADDAAGIQSLITFLLQPLQTLDGSVRLQDILASAGLYAEPSDADIERIQSLADKTYASGNIDERLTDIQSVADILYLKSSKDIIKTAENLFRKLLQVYEANQSSRESSAEITQRIEGFFEDRCIAGNATPCKKLFECLAAVLSNTASLFTADTSEGRWHTRLRALWDKQTGGAASYALMDI